MNSILLRAIPVALMLLVHISAVADELRGRVVGVTDGDTLTVLGIARQQFKVRLAGIDAPEKRQAFGQASKRRMSDLAFQRDVLVRWTKHDRFGRIVGVALVDGNDVGLALIESGLAWHFKRYAHEQSAHDRGTYARAEDLARAARIGLWSERDPIPPWEYRRHMHHGSVLAPELTGRALD
jgi:endonuclease YncB( thermonuclease family)